MFDFGDGPLDDSRSAWLKATGRTGDEVEGTPGGSSLAAGAVLQPPKVEPPVNPNPPVLLAPDAPE